MKRLIAMALALMLCGCALAEGNWYVDEGQALAMRMQALAADEAYMGLMMAGSNEETLALKDAFVQTDLSKPSAAWFMALPEKEEILSAVERFSILNSGEEAADTLSELTDVGKEELVKRLPAAAPTILTAQSGVKWVTLFSVLTVTESMEEPEDFRPGYLLLEFPGDYAALVTFSRPLGGYVGASAILAPTGCLETVKPMLTYVKALGLDLELEEVDLR